MSAYLLFLAAVSANSGVASAHDQGFNLSAAEDNKTSKEILGESRSDSKELTKLVSTLTLIFLPASFVSVS